MKTNTLFATTLLLMLSAAFLFSSCKEDERITAQDTQDITEEAATDSYFQDMDDMAGVAISAGEETEGGRIFSGGRRITIEDDRFGCEGIVVDIIPADNSTLDVPRGSITVDFGQTGCSDVRGNVRRGKIIFTYSGRRFRPGSTVVTTVEDYVINGIRLEGTRTLTTHPSSTVEEPRFIVTLENGKATFEDETFATRDSNITWYWDKNGTPFNFLDDKLVIDQSSTASGTTRGGRSYDVSLLEPLEFKRFCGIAVTGIKKYVIDNNKEIMIDYGDGECDRKVTVSVNGVTRNITVGN